MNNEFTREAKNYGGVVTTTISIPRKIVKELGIKAGSRITLEIKNVAEPLTEDTVVDAKDEPHAD